MKKLFILTSVLAIAACGGGGGGGSSGLVAGGGSPSSVSEWGAIPAGVGSAISAASATSNAEVTNMKSEVLVASSATNPGVVVSRSASAPGDNGYTFTSYKLDDVKFFAADASTTTDGYLNLGIDDTGKIDRMYMVVGGVGANADAGMARGTGTETSTFKAPVFEFVRDSYAQVSDTDFVVGNSVDAVRTKLEQILEDKYNLTGGEWVVDGGELQYRVGGIAQSLGSTSSLSNNQGALEDYMRGQLNFQSKGKWVTVGDNRKYLEYGDQAVYRTVGTAETTMDSLNATSASLGLGHWNRTDEIIPIVTYGSDIDGQGTSLQYADFGHFNPVYETKRVDLTGGSEATTWSNDPHGQYKTQTEQEIADELAVEDYQLFAGGYAIKGNSMDSARPSLDPINGQTYKGMAVGRVYTSMQFEDGIADKTPYLAQYGITSGDGHNIAKAFTTHDATMKITKSGNDVVQTLTMPFYTHAVGDKYYDITVVKTGNDVTSTTFDAGGLSDTAEGNQIASQYRKYDAFDPGHTITQDFNPGYYGVNTPVEAAGTASMGTSYEAIENVADRDYEVQAAWGMKLQPQQ